MVKYEQPVIPTKAHSFPQTSCPRHMCSSSTVLTRGMRGSKTANDGGPLRCKSIPTSCATIRSFIERLLCSSMVRRPTV